MENSRGASIRGWDGESETNYSVVFSQARANKKKHKSEVPAHKSLGNEFELLPQERNDVEAFSTVKHQMVVPQFGGWDGKTQNETNYSVVFTHARANRKKQERTAPTPRKSLGNEFEFPTLCPNDAEEEEGKEDEYMV
ncbi:hypothetical protein Sango_0412500 [Sesamum angolense]|uniref:RIN4 pathogenic type III effector avirulence factor Avr cleavage site domain-containing protein n=1 Tax=Sesamum angolense TaxID=2727404 RepID=A0AAE1XAM2_9LAMI|nr:hypothetical protein Sango_0412500 [Sesamum angolense]